MQRLWLRGSVEDVQYLLVECQNSIPPPRHSQQSVYLCNHKGSTDTENRGGGGGVSHRVRDERQEMMRGGGGVGGRKITRNMSVDRKTAE